ncbi:MAG: AMP-binding protein [Magnetococcales bacterium]|nr:AMP-binding protein [Magnetococcales bacterium]
MTRLKQCPGPLFSIQDSRSGEMVACDGQDFYRWTLSWAKRLESCPDKVIMILGRTTPMMMAAWFGSVLAGRLPAFISYPSQKITAEAYGEKLANYRARFQSGIFVGEEEDRSIWPSLLVPDLEEPAALPDPATLPGWQGFSTEPLFLQCSSGTTGLQKAVAIREDMLTQQVERYCHALKLDPVTDCIVSWLPLYHDMGLVATFLLPLLTGTRVYYLDPFQWAASPGLLLETMERYRGTLTWLPNFAFSFLCKNPGRYQLGHVRAFINCSEPVSMGSFQRFMATHGVRPDQLAVCYALAENVFAATQGEIGQPPVWLGVEAAAVRRNRISSMKMAVLTDGDASQLPEWHPVFSCGIPLEGVDVEVRTRNGEDVGEIYLRGPCAVAGYYQSSPLADNGWFPTGDLGFVYEGQLYLCGRQKDLIIQNGKNIYPQDVEAVIQAHGAIHPGRVAVVGEMDHELDTQRTMALVEPEKNLSLSQRGDIITDLQSRLHHHFDINVQVAWVPRGWLRKTSSGKIARESNLERYKKSQQDRVHLCGDSHVRIFWTSPTSHHNRFKGVHAYWLGLLWSGNWQKTIAFFNELIIQKNVRDPLIIQAGEPECRSIFPSSSSPEARIRQSVAGYREFFQFLKKKSPTRLAFMTGIPTAPINGDNGDRQWPVCGSPQERYCYQRQFYAAMQELCTELSVHFIDVCTPLLGADGFISPDCLVDGTHLDFSWIHVYVEALEKSFGVIHLESNDFPPECSLWDGSFEHFSRLVQRKVRDHVPLIDDLPWDRMISSSLLDSLAIVELVAMLNQVCGLKIEPRMISRNDFESIEGIYQKFVLCKKS